MNGSHADHIEATSPAGASEEGGIVQVEAAAMPAGALHLLASVFGLVVLTLEIADILFSTYVRLRI